MRSPETAEMDRKLAEYDAKKHDYLENTAHHILKEIEKRRYFRGLSDPGFRKLIEIVIAGTDEDIEMEHFINAVRQVGRNGNLAEIIETITKRQREEKIPLEIFLAAVTGCHL